MPNSKARESEASYDEYGQTNCITEPILSVIHKCFLSDNANLIYKKSQVFWT